MRAYRAWDRFDGTDTRGWLHTVGLRLAFNERDRRIRWDGCVVAGMPLRRGSSRRIATSTRRCAACSASIGPRCC
jgi:hypothetical protein